MGIVLTLWHTLGFLAFLDANLYPAITPYQSRASAGMFRAMKEGDSPKNKVILVAEDSVDDEMFFLRVLQNVGILNPVTIVRTGAEVISYLKGEGLYADRRRHPLPTVLFLDLLMPGGDGWEVMKWIKAHPGRNRMLIVVLTGPTQRAKLPEAYQAGANSFLVKPFGNAELEGLIDMWPEVWMLPSHRQRPQDPPSGKGPALRPQP